MHHDRDLLRALSSHPVEQFEGEVFRVTSLTRDATEPRANGGRWGLPQGATAGTSVLYTSLDRDGAIAEVASYRVLLTPIPRSNPVKVSRLYLTASKVLRLSMDDLEALGVNRSKYGQRDYFLTQQIGAGVEHLGYDALIAPSARYDCDNLVIFAANSGFDERLEVLGSEQVEWRDWARRRGLLDGLE